MSLTCLGEPAVGAEAHGEAGSCQREGGGSVAREGVS